jgi:hypothetical protein
MARLQMTVSNLAQGVPSLTADLSVFEDAASEPLSTLEALSDIADTVETIVLSLATEQERDAYLALADEYDEYAESMPDGSVLKSPEQNTQMFELAKRMEDVFEAILRGCPSDIRTLHAAIHAAIDAEASRA